MRIKTALISVYDKNNIILVLKILKKFKINIISSGGTYKEIKKLGFKCEEVKHFSKKLLEFIKINIIFWDERLSTSAQEKILIDKDVSRKKRKKVIDKLAASYFLQSFLDFLNN